jgi:Tfp pilus assembly protein PilX
MTIEEGKMQNHTVRFSKSIRRHQSKSQRGIALLTTLLLLLLMTGLSLAMVVAARSDMMINGYYRNFRGSFYAADSGLNIARQDMMNQVVAAIPTTFNASAQPIPNGTDATVQTFITNNYGQSYHSITNSGPAASSWPEKYKITSATFTLAQCTVLGGTGTCSAPSGSVTGYQYIYNYALVAQGQSQGNESATLSDRGSVIVNATLVAASTTTSFAGWGMFIDNSPICNGSTLVPGTITGPVFTNGAWNFGTSGSYIFTDSVGSANADAGFQFSGNTCDQLTANSDKQGNTTIAPTFQNGFQKGQSTIPLPQNSFNQERAVLDRMGASNAPVTKQNLNNSVRNLNGTPYPMSGASSGVFLPYSVDSNGNNPTFTGGGIYVEGDAKVVLSPTGANGQIYTITQGGTTTTVTITPGSTPGSGTTVIASGSTSLTISGVPAVQDPATGGLMGDGTMLYVNGNITSLQGPGQGQAAVNDGTGLTITAANNITITGDILYKSTPVTLTQTTQNGQNVPADTLIPANNHQQALGIFTASGDIQLNNGQSNNNLEVDASIATISQGGSGGLTNIGNQINTLTIVGGRIQNNIKNINTTTRNVFFDRRFGGNFSPPFFPSTTVHNGSIDSATSTVSLQRTQWLNQSSYF